MKRILSNPYLLLVSRFLLGLVFILASIDKIYAPDAFAANIESYRLLPGLIINAVAILLPWMELLCGVFLIGGVYLRGSSAILGTLLGIFSLAIVTALLRGLTIDCGCFGKEHATPISWMKVAEDIGLMAVAFHIYLFGTMSRAETQSTNAEEIPSYT